MPLNHTSTFINRPDDRKEVHDWIDLILENYTKPGDKFELQLVKNKPNDFLIGPFVGKRDNQVVDAKIDPGLTFSRQMLKVEVAWRDVDELIKERENESKPT